MIFNVEKLKNKLDLPPNGDVIIGDKEITLSLINQNTINRKEYKKHILKIFLIVISIEEKNVKEVNKKILSKINVASLIATNPYSR